MAGQPRIPTQERRAAFAARYLANGRNATEAAQHVGVPTPESAATQGTKWLRHPQVRSIIDEADGRATKKAGVTVERVVKELRDILIADVSEAFDADGAMKPLSQWPKHLRRAVSAIETETHTNRKTGEDKTVPKKVRFWSKTDAADKLMKHLGGYAPEKHEHTINGHADRMRAARSRVPK